MPRISIVTVFARGSTESFDSSLVVAFLIELNSLISLGGTRRLLCDCPETRDVQKRQPEQGKANGPIDSGSGFHQNKLKLYCSSIHIETGLPSLVAGINLI